VFFKVVELRVVYFIVALFIVQCVLISCLLLHYNLCKKKDTEDWISTRKLNAILEVYAN